MALQLKPLPYKSLVCVSLAFCFFGAWCLSKTAAETIFSGGNCRHVATGSCLRHRSSRRTSVLRLEWGVQRSKPCCEGLSSAPRSLTCVPAVCVTRGCFWRQSLAYPASISHMQRNSKSKMTSIGDVQKVRAPKNARDLIKAILPILATLYCKYPLFGVLRTLLPSWGRALTRRRRILFVRNFAGLAGVEFFDGI